MATELTGLFGTDINVTCQPVRSVRNYYGFPGVHGLLSKWMGTRGQVLIVTGRIEESGQDYETARVALQDVIDEIETCLWDEPADYTFKGYTYTDVVFDRLELIPDADGKSIHWVGQSKCVARFVCYGRVMV